MSRTHRNEPCHWTHTWGNKPGRGKWHKRQLHKAERRAAKGTGKTRTVAYWTSEVNWRGH